MMNSYHNDDDDDDDDNDSDDDNKNKNDNIGADDASITILVEGTHGLALPELKPRDLVSRQRKGSVQRRC